MLRRGHTSPPVSDLVERACVIPELTTSLRRDELTLSRDALHRGE